MKKYDSSQHYHMGYYEDGYDLEVTAYKEYMNQFGMRIFHTMR